MNGSNKKQGGSKGPSTVQPKKGVLNEWQLKAGVQPAPKIKIGK